MVELKNHHVASPNETHLVKDKQLVKTMVWMVGEATLGIVSV